MTQGDMRFYADQVEYFGDTNRMVATGNVLLIESDHQIAADRADFNAKTRLGTFYNARGFATLGAPQGRTPAQIGTSDPDVQFYGETLEKTGEDTYIITNGGFTSCVQANPRWEMTSGSLKLRVDHYALLRNMLLKVKGVPAIYLPIDVLPPQQGQSEHRVPDAELRQLDDTRGRRSATPSSGRSAAARTRRSCTTGIRRPVRPWPASIDTCRLAGPATSARIS